MRSTKWYPLPEVSLEEGKSWWKDSKLKTTSVSINSDLGAKSTTSCQSSLVTPTRQTDTPAQDQSSQADLTITSLLTISPSKHSPHPYPSPQSFRDEPTCSTSQPTIAPTLSVSRGEARQTPCTMSSASSLSSRLLSSAHEHSPPEVSAHVSPPNEHSPSTHSSQSGPSHKPSFQPDMAAFSSTDTTLLSKQISLLELDKLWRKFLASSLLNGNKENVSSSSSSRCTCKASHRDSHRGAVLSEAFKMKVGTNSSRNVTFSTDTSSAQVNDTQTQSNLSYSTPKLVDRSVQTFHSDTPSVACRESPTAFTIPVTQSQPHQQDSHEPDKSSAHRSPVSFFLPLTNPPGGHHVVTDGSLATTTSSSLSQPGTQSGKVTWATSVPVHKTYTMRCLKDVGASPVLDTHPLEGVTPASGYEAYQITSSTSDCITVQATSVSSGSLSLSEAFTLHRPDFIVRSQRRERKVRQMSECRVRAKTRNSGVSCERPSRPTTHPQHSNHQSAPYASYHLLMGYGTRPRMGHRKMYQATKKAWDSLPEVRKKVEQEKKQSQAETNRLRVKLYQKEVLTRMRKRTMRQH